MQEADGFCLREDVLHALTPDVDMVILANPNNPTGRYIPADLLYDILEQCKNNHSIVVMDECFMTLSRDGARSLLSNYQQYPNVILVRAFTKTYAMPGLRLGYLLCADTDLLREIRRHLPEWNVSSLAQQAGLAVLNDAGDAYLAAAGKVLETESNYLAAALQALGIRVFPTDSNFLLLYSELPLYEQLLKRQILIRDCSSYPGLSSGYYRIAIRGHEDNVQLIEQIKEITEQGGN
jgi:histidinol-phosphate/aromatic aminotransferase/cobyric acid decarboxylase-like protein